MARKRSNNKPTNVYKPISTFPELHDRICAAVSDDSVYPRWVERDSDNTRDHNEEYSTNIMGTFRCANKSCSSERWGSKMVSIVIRGYVDDGYHAEVFNQRCRACNQLGVFSLNEQSYIDRVAYRIKKWAGVEVERPPYNAGEGPPHQSELCEGCKRGYCQKNKYLDL
ncbi:zinc-binding domain-domain-containing protein [Microdochium bolleyi]|uniref:Zinc-binding domain-domain-containing protein n=1 Tax=Microdochium bolleyi TaxID=196109 RepID=A0A136J4I4_9PEZI|nr:zinc-binding domain-domain-containing protein [Microdochium bolleyi]